MKNIFISTVLLLAVTATYAQVDSTETPSSALLATGEAGDTIFELKNTDAKNIYVLGQKVYDPDQIVRKWLEEQAIWGGKMFVCTDKDGYAGHLSYDQIISSSPDEVSCIHLSFNSVNGQPEYRQIPSNLIYQFKPIWYQGDFYLGGSLPNPTPPKE